MDYIAVKDIAIKGALSEQKVQELCTQGQVFNCQLVSGAGLYQMRRSKL